MAVFCIFVNLANVFTVQLLEKSMAHSQEERKEGRSHLGAVANIPAAIGPQGQRIGLGLSILQASYGQRLFPKPKFSRSSMQRPLPGSCLAQGFLKEFRATYLLPTGAQ